MGIGDKMRVVISAGGTGGHIYPALAIINKIKEKEPNSEFLYIGTHNRMEKDIVPKQGIPFNEQVFKWVYCRETGLQELVIHNMVNFCLVNNIKYLDDKFYFATTCYDWKTGEITTFRDSPRKPDDIEQLGIKELETFKYDFIPSDQKNEIIWHQDGCCDCGFYISCKIENEWLIFYYMKDSFVSVEHIMLGIFEYQEAKIKELFKKYNITKNDFLKVLKDVRGNSNVTSENPEETYDVLKKYGRDFRQTATCGGHLADKGACTAYC